MKKLEAQDIAGAIERFREAIRLAPENARAHYQLALALRRTGAERGSASPSRRSAAAGAVHADAP